MWEDNAVRDVVGSVRFYLDRFVRNKLHVNEGGGEGSLQGVEGLLFFECKREGSISAC